MTRRGIVFAALFLSFSSSAWQTTDTDTASDADIGDTPSSFIRDDLFIYMHAGPTREYRILGSIDAGEPVAVLETVDDFTQIRDDKGRVGWVETRFVTNDQPIHLRYQALQNQLSEGDEMQQRLATENQQLQREVADAKEQITSLSAMIETQQAKLTELESQDTERENEELITWFTRGGMVAGGGVLLGLLLSFIPKRKRRESEWF